LWFLQETMGKGKANSLAGGILMVMANVAIAEKE
jgi:hypothetical protein